MIHLPFTIAAYLFNALSLLTNKFLLKKTIKNPLTYIFYISLLSLLILILSPFVKPPSWEGFSLASFSTIFWTAGAYFMFWALKVGPLSRVIPIIGSLIPLILLLFSSQTEPLKAHQVLAVLTLVSGMVFLTVLEWRGKFSAKETLFEILSALFFAISYLLIRQAYQAAEFLSVIVWSRFVLIPFCLAYSIRLILVKKLPVKEAKSFHLTSSGLIFIAGQTFGAVSEFLLLFSISLANPALVNSLQGTQYVFLFILSLLLSKKYPAVFEEKYTFLTLVSKIIGIILIGGGLYLLAVY